MSVGKVVPIAGFPVQEATAQDLAIYLLSALRHHEKISLLFANSNFVVKCKALLRQMWDDKVVIVNDGLGLNLAARFIHGRSFKANLNGTDFTPYLFRESSRPLRVFLLGGRPEIVKKAAHYVAQELGQAVSGYCDGYSGMQDTEAVIEQINRSGAEILLVALGNPLQEEWILRHRAALNVSVVSGVGALFDFWSGDKSRAPQFVQRIRMEWFYRLCQEPRRLMRRYTIDTLVFFAYCLQYKKISREPRLAGDDMVANVDEPRENLLKDPS